MYKRYEYPVLCLFALLLTGCSLTREKSKPAAVTGKPNGLMSLAVRTVHKTVDRSDAAADEIYWLKEGLKEVRVEPGLTAERREEIVAEVEQEIRVLTTHLGK